MKIYTIDLGKGLKPIEALLKQSETTLEIGDIVKVKVEVDISKSFSLLKTIPVVFYGKVVDKYNDFPKESLSVIEEIVSNGNDRDRDIIIEEYQQEINRLNLELSEAQKDRDNYKKAYEDLKKQRKIMEVQDNENKDVANKEESKPKETENKETMEDYTYEVLKELFGRYSN